MQGYKDVKIEEVLVIAKQAGERIMSYRGKVEAEYKADDSPVTKADKEASRIIIDGLNALTPHIPVISEEASADDNVRALKEPVRWVTDPLDGTKSFLKGRDGFGVHIALVDQGVPVKGAIYFPAKDMLYFTGNDGAAYRQQGEGAVEKIAVTRSFEGRDLRAAVHHKQERRPPNIGGHFYEAVCGVGGGRICMVAEGDADLAWMVRESSKWAYSHWDVAAAHAVLKAAGGDLIDVRTKSSVTYSNENFGVPSAVAGHKKILDKVFKP